MLQTQLQQALTRLENIQKISPENVHTAVRLHKQSRRPAQDLLCFKFYLL